MKKAISYFKKISKSRVPHLHITYLESTVILFLLFIVGVTVFFSTRTITQTTYKQTQDTEASAVDPDIIEGGNVEIGQWPFIGRLVLCAEGNSECTNPFHICTVSLIHPQFVLTAAHCMPSEINIDINRLRVHFPTVSSRMYRLNDYIINPGYKKRDSRKPFQSYDVALMKIDYHNEIDTIPLPLLWSGAQDPSPPLIGSEVIGVGGGMVRGDMASSPVEDYGRGLSGLREAIMRELTDREYNELGLSDFYKNSLISVYPPYICFGDSGGPLMVWNNTAQRVEIIGLSSFVLPAGVTNLPDWTEDDFNKYLPRCKTSKGDDTYATFYAPMMYKEGEGRGSNARFIKKHLEQYPPAMNPRFVGRTFDNYHCHSTRTGLTENQLNELPLCFSDENDAYSIRRGCNQRCPQGYRNCRYGENRGYIGCQSVSVTLPPTLPPERATQDNMTNDRTGEANRENNDRDQSPRGGDSSWSHYWDTECVCTDNTTYKTLKDKPETNDSTKCNSQQFKEMCKDMYPNDFPDISKVVTYWDEECVKTDNKEWLSVEGVTSKEKCEALNR